MRLLNTLKKYKKKIALISENKHISFLELENYSNDLAKNFKKENLMFLICENNIESILFYLSSLKKNCALVLLEKNIAEINLNQLISKYEPRYIFVNKKNNYNFSRFNTKKIYMNYILLENKKKIKIKINKDLKILISTSGTTGNPKYVKLTKQNIDCNTLSILKFLKINKKDTTITTLPMNYVYGLSIINTHLLAGAKIVLNDYSVIDKKFWSSLIYNKITNINGVPYLYEILDKIKFLEKDLSSIRFFTQAGGKIDKRIQKKLITFCLKNKKKIFFMYGAAEATARMGYLPWKYVKEKFGSIGKAIQGGKFWLEDKSKKKIKHNQKLGELIYSGKNVSPGYAKSYEDLNENNNCNILRTGDYAKRDKDGFYYLLGRSDKFIKIQGNRLNLEDIEMYTSSFGIKSICKLNKKNKIAIFVEKDVDEKMLLKKIKNKITVHPSNFLIQKITKFPINKNLKISYNHKMFN